MINNKVCLVTGGTRGIGRAIAKMLLEEGASVAITGRTEVSTRSAVSELYAETNGRIEGTAADVRNPEEVAAMFEFVDTRFGGLDVLVNNAGIGVFRSVSDLTINDWKLTIETNLSGVFYCCREAFHRFEKRGAGYIINLSSLAGKNPFVGGSAYNASKFGLNGFSEAMMLDKRNDNIRVSYIMPGSVATEFSGKSADSGADWKIHSEDVAEIVRTLLKMPERTLISRVEVRPAKPKR